MFARPGRAGHGLAVRASSDDAPSVLRATWFDLDDHCGVLDLGRLKLSLFVIVPLSGAKMSSWWTTEDGTWLMSAHIGAA
jgi:hypothetical protein